MKPGSEGHERHRRLAGLLVGCALCGRLELAAGLRTCGRCRQLFRPTRVRLALDALGLSVLEAAQIAGLRRSLMHRALAGLPIGRRAAPKLARALGLPVEHLRAGEPPPDVLRTRRRP